MSSQTNKRHRSSGGGESLWGEIKAPKKKNKDSSMCDEMLIKHWRFHSLFQVSVYVYSESAGRCKEKPNSCHMFMNTHGQR